MPESVRKEIEDSDRWIKEALWHAKVNRHPKPLTEIEVRAKLTALHTKCATGMLTPEESELERAMAASETTSKLRPTPESRAPGASRLGALSSLAPH